MWILGVMVEMLKFVAIIAIQTKAGSKPHETTTILQDSIYRSLGQAILYGEMIKFECIILAKSGNAQEEQKKNLVKCQSKVPQLY